MNSKNILDFINANFTMRVNVNCYNMLNNFADAMRHNQYFPISDEEIHRGVEYKKAELKSQLNIFRMFFPNEDPRSAENLIETLCNLSLQQFLNYKHLCEKTEKI